MSSALQKQVKKKVKQFNDTPDVDKKEYAATSDPDEFRIKGQDWFVFSWVDSEHNRAGGIGQKFQGAFATEKEASAHARRVHAKDSLWDTNVCKSWEWLTLPLRKDIEPYVRQHYDNPQLDKLMKERFLQARRSKKEIDGRVSDAREKAQARMRKIKGPDYEMKSHKTEAVEAHEQKMLETVPEYRQKMYTEAIGKALSAFINANDGKELNAGMVPALMRLISDYSIDYGKEIGATE